MTDGRPSIAQDAGVPEEIRQPHTPKGVAQLLDETKDNRDPHQIAFDFAKSELTLALARLRATIDGGTLEEHDEALGAAVVVKDTFKAAYHVHRDGAAAQGGAGATIEG